MSRRPFNGKINVDVRDSVPDWDPRCPRALTARWTTCAPWDSLSDDEKRLFARMAEVYAGFSES